MPDSTRTPNPAVGIHTLGAGLLLQFATYALVANGLWVWAIVPVLGGLVLALFGGAMLYFFAKDYRQQARAMAEERRHDDVR